MKSLINNKKGLFYLLITTLFVIIMVAVFLAYKQYAYTDRQKVIETRIKTIDEFIKDIDTDSKRVIYISGFRSLIALEDYIASSGQYLNNTEELFRIAFYNGTVNGTKVEILLNSTYSDYLDKLRLIAEKIGLDIFLNVTNITLYHDSPWSVEVIVTTFVNITDKRGLAKWEFTRDYYTSVSLNNIRDPVYSVATYGRVPNTIRITNVTDYVNDTNNDTTGLQTHINNSFYVENTKAPSFLMRMKGSFSNSTHGIESLVNIPELIDQLIEYDSTKSIMDYVLLGNYTQGFDVIACNVDNMPTWFKIDLNHTNKYEVNDLNYTIC